MRISKKASVISIVTILVVTTAGAGFWLLHNGGVQTISGTITHIGQTCRIVWHTDKDNKVLASGESAGCPVADFIEIDDIYTVYTAGQASASPQDIFEKHDSSWEVGDKVSLTVIGNTSSSFSLNCDACGEN